MGFELNDGLFYISKMIFDAGKAVVVTKIRAVRVQRPWAAANRLLCHQSLRQRGPLSSHAITLTFATEFLNTRTLY